SFFQSAEPRSATLLSAHSAAHPETWGVAMLVPLIVLYRFGRGHDENTSRPGAASSILPTLLNEEGTSVESSEAIDMIVGELAGAPVGNPLELPAAAMISRPLLSAEEPAAV